MMHEFRLHPGQEILIDGARVRVKECRFGSVLLESDLQPVQIIHTQNIPVAEAACDARGLSGADAEFDLYQRKAVSDGSDD